MAVNGHMLHTRRGSLRISDYFEKLIRSNRDERTVNLKIIRDNQSLGILLAVANLQILQRIYQHEPQEFARPSISLAQPYRAQWQMARRHLVALGPMKTTLEIK